MMTWNKTFFNSPSSNLMELIIFMHDYVMMLLISILIMIFLFFFFFFSSKSFNMEFYENHQLESVWTLIPFITIFFIAIPSLKSLYMLDTCTFCGLTINILGHQWYWSYIYKDLMKFIFDSYMMLNSSPIRLLEVDNRILIPTAMPVRFLVSSMDVIHSWTIPSFGIKMDAVPGRMNQFCFSSKRSGVFFGQCSEICGANHSFMPIVMESVKMENFLNIMKF